MDSLEKWISSAINALEIFLPCLFQEQTYTGVLPFFSFFSRIVALVYRSQFDYTFNKSLPLDERQERRYNIESEDNNHSLPGCCIMKSNMEQL